MFEFSRIIVSRGLATRRVSVVAEGEHPRLPQGTSQTAQVQGGGGAQCASICALPPLQPAFSPRLRSNCPRVHENGGVWAERGPRDIVRKVLAEKTE